MHPKKSLIFQGTRFIPLSFKGEGEVWVLKGEAPSNFLLLRGKIPKGSLRGAKPL